MQCNGALARWAQRFFDLGAAGAPPPAAAAPLPSPPTALVFDTETCGSKGGQLAVQIAWVVYDRAGGELSARCEYLALPPGRTINVFARRVHGISDATLRAKGLAPQFVLAEFFEAIDRVAAAGGCLVAHNAQFDAQVVSNTAESCGLARDLRASECLCTMQLSKRRLDLRNKRGALKPPKNAELYAHLVGIELDHATLHDALADVRVTGASFFAGRARRWW